MEKKKKKIFLKQKHVNPVCSVHPEIQPCLSMLLLIHPHRSDYESCVRAALLSVMKVTPPSIQTHHFSVHPGERNT